ncbi:MAG: BREX-1 system adenine-specific DNA-methyltransferase PglX, partial [Sulfobacillus thermotolerans]|nr:BREX-1 system adenine-specific DNA-methyltransferase PglX [Sulfobacillus thermotolerans]
MNKSALKTFATAARRQLMEQVAVEAARLGMTSDRPITYATHGDYLTIGQTQYPMAWRDAVESLNQAWHQRGFAALVEEVAYTWFNRFVAIRYMEIHDYLPSHIRVLSSRTPGQVDPDILLHYADLPWPIDVAMIDDAMRMGQRDKVFRQLLIEQCNQLHATMPFLFEKLNDYTELLLPNHLLHTDSVISRLVHNVAEEDFHEVEVIGWLYQYYISEKNKQIVGMNKGVVQKEDLAAATQLFTPRWIVQYMVQNSLGRAWKASNPESSLDQSWDYYLFRGEALASAPLSLESVKIMDPACGSGHILVYAFDLLFAMYEEMGYPVSTIPAHILEKNLFGMDIDDRATQLATLALVMKAREKDRKFFERNVVPNILAFKDASDIAEDILEKMVYSKGDRNGLSDLMKYHHNAKQFGSLLEGYPIESTRFMDRVAELDANAGDMVDEASVSVLRSQLMPILRQNAMLQDVYDIVITNPPYHNKYNPVLKDFMTKNYKDYKGDLYSAFIHRCAHWTKDNGYTAMMTPFTWMFISSHEKLRNNLLQQYSISSLVQLEYSGFEEATVPICTFVVQHQTHYRKGVYLRLEEFKGADLQPVKVHEAVVNSHVSYRYVSDSNEFHAIPGSPIAYWASDAVRRVFENGVPLTEIAQPRVGLQTSDNDRFLRLWYEVALDRIGFSCGSAEEALRTGCKWFPLNKGGKYRKWYGNQEYVVNWEEDGREIREFVDQDGKVRSRPQNVEFYFLPAITWTDISSSKFGVRYSPQGFIFDHKGNCVFASERDKYYLTALLSTVVINHLVGILNPTISFQVGDVANLPIIMSDSIKPDVDRLAEENIQIAQEEWDDFETSWNFTQHPLVKYGLEVSTIADAYVAWHDHAEQRFRQMQANETELNRLFIHLYGLQDELTPDVPDDDITLRRAD